MTARKVKPTEPDAFSLSRLRDGVGDRWRELRTRHRLAADAMLGGMICAEFTDDEIDVLRRCWSLCPYDELLISRTRSGLGQRQAVHFGGEEVEIQ